MCIIQRALWIEENGIGLERAIIIILCLHNIEERSARTFFQRVKSALDNTFENTQENDNIHVESNMSVFIAHEKITGLNEILDEMVMSVDLRSR